MIAPASTDLTVEIGAPSLSSGIVVSDGLDVGIDIGRPVLLAPAPFALWIANKNVGALTNTFKVSERLGSPATATFQLLETGSYVPLRDSEVLYYRNGRLLFAGLVQDVKLRVIDGFSLQRYKGLPGEQRSFYYVDVACVDYHRILQGRYISFDYREYTSLKAILEHAITNFLDGEGCGLAPMVDHIIEDGADFLPNDVTVWEFLQDLAKQFGRDIWIDYHRIIHCELRYVAASQLRLATGDGAPWRKVEVSLPDKLYRNVQGVRMSVQCTSSRREQVGGSGRWNIGSTLYCVAERVRPRVWLNGNAKSVIFDHEMGALPYDFMFRVGTRAIVGNPLTLITPPTATDEIVIEYEPTTDSDVVWVENAAEIAARAARSNTSGRRQHIHEAGELVSEPSALLMAESLRERSVEQVEISFEINDVDLPNPYDLGVGTSIPIDSSRPFFHGRAIVTAANFEEVDNTWLRYRITAQGPAAIPIASATNTRPIRIGTERPHGLVTGQMVSIFGCEGNTGANVCNWPVVAEDAYTLRLPGTRGTGTYKGGGQVVAGLTTGMRAIVETTGDGVSPIIITTRTPHNATTPPPGENPWTPSTPPGGIDYYDGLNGNLYPAGSVGGLLGNTNANGTGHTLIPLDEDTLAVGPQTTAVGGIDIASANGNGSTVTITTIDPHGLSTGTPVTVINCDEVSGLNGNIHAATVVNSTTLTLPAGLTGSGTQGTVVAVAGLFATAEGNGSRVRVTCNQSHNLTTDQYITIPKATSFTAIEKNWHVTTVSSTVFDLQASSGLTGSSSEVWFMPWPIGNGTGDGGFVGPSLGLPEITVTGISGGTITTGAPHGITPSPNWPNLQLTVETGGTAQNVTVTGTPSSTELTVSPSPTEVSGTGRATAGGANPQQQRGRANGGGGGREALANLYRRARPRRNRTIETATFLIATAIPGYASGAVQTGTDVTNAYVVKNDGVLRHVIVYFKAPPTGSGVSLDIKCNGVSILAAPIEYREASTLPQRYNAFAQRNLAVRENDRLTLDIVSVGSDFPGCDGTVNVIIGTR